jgi:hypothetical protein
MTDFRHTTDAETRRQEKALALARQLYAELTPARRHELERAAGTRPASPLTWAAAAGLLAERLRWDDRHPEAGP